MFKEQDFYSYIEFILKIQLPSVESHRSSDLYVDKSHITSFSEMCAGQSYLLALAEAI